MRFSLVFKVFVIFSLIVNGWEFNFSATFVFAILYSNWIRFEEGSSMFEGWKVVKKLPKEDTRVANTDTDTQTRSKYWLLTLHLQSFDCNGSGEQRGPKKDERNMSININNICATYCVQRSQPVRRDHWIQQRSRTNINHNALKNKKKTKKKSSIMKYSSHYFGLPSQGWSEGGIVSVIVVIAFAVSVEDARQDVTGTSVLVHPVRPLLVGPLQRQSLRRQSR